MSQSISVGSYGHQKLRRTALGVGLGLGLASWGVGAQQTTGSIYGQVPVAAGETITVSNAAGVNRTVAVDPNGRYNVSSLPVNSSYTVNLVRDGKIFSSRSNVSLLVGSAVEVSFADAPNTKQLDTVVVSASAIPPIDVKAVDSRTVVTAAQLAILPLARTAEAIALLAPGATEGSGYFKGANGNALVSFGGSSVTENAYYINGFNVTDPLSGFGGTGLPYGAIDQVQVLTGGYDAAYGRSSGGVINLVGKSGTNEWHFGGQSQWSPAFARSGGRNYYYADNGTDKAGKINRYREGNNEWNALVSAYAGGALIKDKLYLFMAVEANQTQGNSTGTIDSPYVTNYKKTDPKHYVKLDWNINDSNILEYTNVKGVHTYEGRLSDYDYASNTRGEFSQYDTSTKVSAQDNILKYTSYVTDDLTVSLLYGKQNLTLFQQTPGYDPTHPNVLRPDRQNPGLNGGSGIVSPNALLTFENPDHRSTNSNFRFDVSYKLGDHTISGGIDNQNTHDVNDGKSTSGPGYAWEYGQHDPATQIIDGANYVGAPGSYPGGEGGYYVAKYEYNTAASVRVQQRAQYVQDNWQVNDKLLLKIGLRNDQFTNLNPNGVPFLRLTKPQFAPRLGFSWDVMGDSSTKIYGNAGRYYLAMPASVALRAAGGSLYTRTYYTYTGIDPNGVPTGLTPIDTGRGPGAPISANGEYGVPPDPNTVAAKNIGSQHQDEFVLGFDKQLNADWNYGAKGIVRHLRRGLDDICDVDTIVAKAATLGYDTSKIIGLRGCYLSNPGRTNTYALANTDGGYYNVPVTAADFGMPKMKRSYYAMNLYLEHPFNGKWQGRVDYTYSRSYGNSEGQVRSDTGQEDVSATVDWDFGKLEEYANGYLPSDRKHQLKFYGSYQINKDWLLGAVVRVASGTPRSCLGYYGAGQTDPAGYGSNYHYCNGVPSRPGDAGRNPWTETLDLNLEYRPAFAGRKLAFNIFAFNVFNQQRVTQTKPLYGQSGALDPRYKLPLYAQTPRYLRFGVAYDF